jgi:hypothetical protein
MAAEPGSTRQFVLRSHALQYDSNQNDKQAIIRKGSVAGGAGGWVKQGTTRKNNRQGGKSEPNVQGCANATALTNRKHAICSAAEQSRTLCKHIKQQQRT